MTPKEIDEIFTYHNPVGIDPERFEKIRNAAKQLGVAILDNGGYKPDVNKSVDKLRECIFYAISSIVFESVFKR